ncbi:MAG: HyaD/HybD family hydrogenase maturation endopeptidase [Dehalococcoidia bacterium]|jgi:hydrogenase maturation protease
MNESVKRTSHRTVVIGVGNLLMKDEGIGIHVMKALQEMPLPDNVTIIDGGTSPDIIACTRSGDKLIIVDSARAGGEPGAIYRFQPDDLEDSAGEVLSVHELGVPQNLRLMLLSGNGPSEVIIIGIEPKEIDWGTELSPELEGKIPEIIAVVLKEIKSG